MKNHYGVLVIMSHKELYNKYTMEGVENIKGKETYAASC